MAGPTASDVTNWMGSIPDEVVSSSSRRVPRVYLKDGGVVKVLDYLNERKTSKLFDEGLAGQGTSVFPVINHHDAIHNDVGDA